MQAVRALFKCIHPPLIGRVLFPIYTNLYYLL
ncbi:hypothetical protein KEN51_CDS0040 [Pseudomonas phage vB_Pae10145-KEN51]|nr:hypothetical protein [Pseudomonas phage ANB1]WNV50373.1 hypothetical protein [Pseudomonas phage PhiPizzaParty]WRQ05895.1 hypothetical protein IPCDMZAV_CDS0372 [Pseudomonas phage 6B]WRQ05982.1 hypothetical protein QAMIJHJT_CDS0050 [Pseudomonas phage 9-Ps-8B]WRQ06390.1 hypothetical protein FOPPYZMZ_CDS0049 [Pseudomonas phage 9Ps-7B]WRQ07151.1 hypothetical protein ZBUARNPM_CDS0402 [Pseudomonas phage 14Ps5-6]